MVIDGDGGGEDGGNVGIMVDVRHTKSGSRC